MQTITIDVTQADIDCGKRGSASKCPVALALRRALPEYPNLSVYCLTYRLGDESDRLSFPKPVPNWISDFDYPKPVQPISFELTIP